MTDAVQTSPIVGHPAFKWAVGAWFALLMGLGLFVMPPQVHELLGDRIGLPDALAGNALRAALSGLAALLGLLLGLALAWRVAASKEAVADAEPDEIDEDVGDIWLHDHTDDKRVANEQDLPRRIFNPREDMAEEGILSENSTDDDFAPSALKDVSDTKSTPVENRRDEQDENPLDEEPAYSSETAPALTSEPVNAETDIVNVETEEGDEETCEEYVDLKAETTSSWDGVNSFVAADHAEVRDKPFNEENAADPSSAPQRVAPEDMSLDALTARLSRALETFKNRSAPREEDDAVIAFLRREARQDAVDTTFREPGTDPQTELRSALEKLNSLGNQK